MKEKQKNIACDCCHCKNRKKELGKADKKLDCCKEKKKEYCQCLEVVQLNVQGKRYAIFQISTHVPQVNSHVYDMTNTNVNWNQDKRF